VTAQLARHVEPEREPLLLRELDERPVRLSRDEARFLIEEHRTHISLRPSFEGDDSWQVRPATYCGIIPLPSGRAIHIEPKVGVANLWRMLGGSLAAEGLTVRWEGESRHLDHGRSVRLIPDMVICDGATPLCIADAKYKETGWDGDVGDEQAMTPGRQRRRCSSSPPRVCRA